MPRAGLPQTGVWSRAPAGQRWRGRRRRHLWSAADILRGSIYSSDYKSFIIGLFFLKRLSDRFDEESKVILRAPIRLRAK